MAIGEKPPERLSRPGEITLLAMIAFGFMLLHIVAGTLLLPGSSGVVTPQEQASLSSTD
jgi:hypothetical protein